MMALIRNKIAEERDSKEPDAVIYEVSRHRHEELLIKEMDHILKKIQLKSSPELFIELYELADTLLKSKGYTMERIIRERKTRTEEQGDYSKKYVIELDNRR